MQTITNKRNQKINNKFSAKTSVASCIIYVESVPTLLTILRQLNPSELSNDDLNELLTSIQYFEIEARLGGELGFEFYSTSKNIACIYNITSIGLVGFALTKASLIIQTLNIDIDEIPQILKALRDEPCDCLEEIQKVKNAIEEMNAYLHYGKKANLDTILYIGEYTELIKSCMFPIDEMFETY